MMRNGLKKETKSLRRSAIRAIASFFFEKHFIKPNAEKNSSAGNKENNKDNLDVHYT